MKTVKIDDADFQRAAQLAELRGISVAELFHEFLTVSGTAETPEAHQARMRLVELARRPDVPRRIIPYSREELYERGVSGHERDRLRGDSPEDGAGEVGKGRGDHAG